MISTRERSSKAEIMDDFNMQGEDLEKTFLDLDKVNRWLGGNKITIDGVRKILKKTKYDEPVKILDVGCGNGSILKQVARWGRQNQIKMDLIGIDANTHAMEIARKNLDIYPEVSFRSMDVFSNDFKSMKPDIILCTLTLHHFSDAEVSQIMSQFAKQVSLGIVINDLQRSKAAYYLFKIFCSAFDIREINRQDGLTSILRSFKRSDFKMYGEALPVARQEIHWRMAFRYQWILYKK